MRMLPTRILLATDGSRDATLAGRIAADLSARTGAFSTKVVRATDGPVLVYRRPGYGRDPTEHD